MKRDLVKWHFSDQAGSYSDESRKRIIPCFDDFYSIGPEQLSCAGEAPAILDVGAGTGLYSAYLLERYPGAHLTLIDFSAEMLDLAKRRFAGYANTSYILGDYGDYNFTDTYDIVISALSIHHMNEAEKVAFYKRVHDMLSPTGEFLNADIVKSESPILNEQYTKQWLAYVLQQEGGAVIHERVKNSMHLDDPSTVADQLQWIHDVGFSVADCVYRFRNFAVFYAKK